MLTGWTKPEWEASLLRWDWCLSVKPHHSVQFLPSRGLSDLPRVVGVAGVDSLLCLSLGIEEYTHPLSKYLSIAICAPDNTPCARIRRSQPAFAQVKLSQEQHEGKSQPAQHPGQASEPWCTASGQIMAGVRLLPEMHRKYTVQIWEPMHSIFKSTETWHCASHVTLTPLHGLTERNQGPERNEAWAWNAQEWLCQAQGPPGTDQEKDTSVEIFFPFSLCLF